MSALVIMAAGLGSRFGGLKQLEPVSPGGALLMDYAIYDALNAGFSKIVFLITKSMEVDFTEQVAARWVKKADVRLAFQSVRDVPPWFKAAEERVKPWGTGHAVLSCAGAVNEPFMVINADDFYGAGAYKLVRGFLDGEKPAGKRCYAMAGYELINTLTEHGSVSRGVCELSAGEPYPKLASITERTKVEPCEGGARYWENELPHKLTGGEAVSVNAWGFDETIFDELRELFGDFLKAAYAPEAQEFFLPTAVDAMMRKGFADVFVLPCREKWYGITYAQDKARVRAAIADMTARGLYPGNIR
jgi:NDP-sugar pyrophosphorylase family protein